MKIIVITNNLSKFGFPELKTKALQIFSKAFIFYFKISALSSSIRLFPELFILA